MAEKPTPIEQVDATIRQVIKQCMALRAEAKKLEEEAAGKKELVNTLLNDLLPQHGLDAVADSAGNVIRRKEVTRTTISGEELRKAMLQHGIDQGLMEMVIAEASKTSISVSIEFRAAKE